MNEKRDNWFNQYHEIPQLGIKGKRGLNDRIQHYNVEDFKDATVIDFGCNMGQMSFQAAEWGAKEVTGIEYDSTAVENAKNINKQLGLDVNFVVDDLDSNFLWNSLDSVDVSMFLAIIDTKELENRYGILSKICSKTKKVMYFEGHGKQPATKYFKNIVDYTDFSQIKYLGQTPVTRPFFRCSREILSSEECVDAIMNSRYNKIAVVGKSLAGKSTIREMLQKSGYKSDIVDDLVHFKADGTAAEKIQPHDIKRLNKVVVFDYRALEYYSDYDVVFFLTPDQKLIGQTRERKNPLRTPYIKSYETLKEIYTVKTY